MNIEILEHIFLRTCVYLGLLLLYLPLSSPHSNISGSLPADLWSARKGGDLDSFRPLVFRIPISSPSIAASYIQPLCPRRKTVLTAGGSSQLRLQDRTSTWLRVLKLFSFSMDIHFVLFRSHSFSPRICGADETYEPS